MSNRLLSEVTALLPNIWQLLCWPPSSSSSSENTLLLSRKTTHTHSNLHKYASSWSFDMLLGSTVGMPGMKVLSFSSPCHRDFLRLFLSSCSAVNYILLSNINLISINKFLKVICWLINWNQLLRKYIIATTIPVHKWGCLGLSRSLTNYNKYHFVLSLSFQWVHQVCILIFRASVYPLYIYGTQVLHNHSSHTPGKFIRQIKSSFTFPEILNLSAIAHLYYRN